MKQVKTANWVNDSGSKASQMDGTATLKAMLIKANQMSASTDKASQMIGPNPIKANQMGGTAGGNSDSNSTDSIVIEEQPVTSGLANSSMIKSDNTALYVTGSLIFILLVILGITVYKNKQDE